MLFCLGRAGHRGPVLWLFLCGWQPARNVCQLVGCVFQGGQEDAVCKTKMENAREDGQEDCVYPSDTSSDPGSFIQRGPRNTRTDSMNLSLEEVSV